MVLSPGRTKVIGLSGSYAGRSAFASVGAANHQTRPESRMICASFNGGPTENAVSNFQEKVSVFVGLLSAAAVRVRRRSASY